MGFWSDFSGKTGANAAKAAAADTYNKQQGAVSRLLGYGDEYKSGTDANAAGYDRYINKFEGIGSNYDPYIQTGTGANYALRNLMDNPDSVRGLPGYQFAQDQGIQALDRSAQARGMSGGRESKDLLRFGTGLADQTYGNQWQRLLGLSQQGLGAVAGQAGVAGQEAGVGGQQIGLREQGLQGQLGARTTAYNGDMTAAGTIGQGDIAAANAKAAGSQNIFNGAMKIGGMALGAFGGGGMPSWMGGGSGGGYTIQSFDSAGNPNYGRS